MIDEKRAEKVANDIGYYQLIREISKLGDEMAATYKSYAAGRTAIRNMESYFFALAAKMELCLSALKTFYDDRETEKYNEIIEHRLKLHENFTAVKQ